MFKDHNMLRGSVPLYQDETVEDLQRGRMRLIQPDHGFRFGEDSVLLAALAIQACPQTKSTLHIADLGAGCGAVSILMAARDKRLNFSAVELDRHRFNCLQRNININGLAERMQAFNIDISILSSKDNRRLWPDRLTAAGCDMVVMNPPYRLPNESSVKKWQHGSEKERSGIMASEEVSVSLKELLQASSLLLKPGARLAMVHRPQRLPDIIEHMQDAGIEPVTLQVMESLPAKAPSRIIVIGRKGIKRGGFRWLPPLIVYDRPGVMSAQAMELYGHESALPQQLLQSGLELKNESWYDKELNEI